jgi:hypothetical protein
MLDIDPIIARLRRPLSEIAALLDSPRLRFSALTEKDVPENSGLYVIYKEEPLEALYVGKAGERGLRFRVMKNHLAYQGDDNFIKYVRAELGLPSRSDARDYVRKNCSVHWIEIADQGRLIMIEHLAIAVVQPRLNRG